MIYCNKCGHEMSDDSLFCSKCGGKIKYEVVHAKNDDIQEIGYNDDYRSIKSRKKIIILTLLMAIIVLIGISVGWWLYSMKLAESEYNKNLRLVVADMIEISSESENIINDYIKAWKFAIDNTGRSFYIFAKPSEKVTLHSGTDEEILLLTEDGKLKLNPDAQAATNPSEAIEIIFNKYFAEGKITGIISERERVKEQIKALNKPKKGYESAFETALQMYSLFEEFISLATDPTGSYISYTTKKSDLTDEIIQKKSEFDVRLPK